MHIGVYLGSMSPEEGGGHTYERDIFEALQAHCHQSSHRFTVFTWSPGQFERLSTPQFRMISLARPALYKTRQRILQLASASIKKITQPTKPFHMTTRFDRLMASSGIQMLWSLNPETLTKEIPYIITIWDLQHRYQPFFPEVCQNGEWEKRERVFSRTLQRAAFIITATQDGKTEIEQFYSIPSGRVKIVPYPTPNFALRPPDRDTTTIIEKHHIPPDFLFYPAQFWPHKNHINLLHAIRWLRDEHQLQPPLVLTGSDKGNQEHIKRTAANLDITDQLHFLGFVSQQELIALYQHALAMPFVTFFGPGNLPPLEACALGCPVIASDVTGARQQLGDAGLFVEPTNIEQIGMAIKALYEKPDLRRELIQKGRQQAQTFSSEALVKRMFTLFDEFELIRRCWETPDDAELTANHFP